MSVLTDSSGKPLRSNKPQDRTTNSQDGVDYIYTDPVSKKKKIAISGVLPNDDFYKSYGTYKSNKDILSGASLKQDLDAVKRQFKPSTTTQTSSGQPTQAAPKPQGIVGDFSRYKAEQAVSTPGTPYVEQAQEVLHLLFRVRCLYRILPPRNNIRLLSLFLLCI